MDEIDSSLKDQKGLVAHQRRLAFSLSLGLVALLESYFDSLNILKPGAKINHLWLKKKKNTVKELIANQLSVPIENLSILDKFLDIAFAIENERDKLAYGKPVSEELLKSKIDIFLTLKREIENV